MSVWGNAAKSCDSLLHRVAQNDEQLTELVVLPSKTFGGAEAERLAEALSHNTHVVSLSASGHTIPEKSLKILGEAVRKSSTLKRLAIGDCCMGDDGVIALLSDGCGSIESLDLSYKNLTRQCMKVVGMCVGNGNLVELHMARNPGISNEGIKAFCEKVQTSSLPMVLRTLDVSECQIGEDGMQFLSDIVKASGCTTLSMSNNPLGAETGQCLAQVLGGSKLESLHLVGCNLGSAGVSSMCLHAIELPTSCRLRLLDLSDNDIGEEGAFRLAESLQAGKWNSLTDLRLSKNHLGERGVSLIAEALPQTCIRSLDLSETNCDSDSFIKLLSGNSRLERLRLFKNELGSTGFTKISKLIGQCPLLELDLGGNQADSEAVEYLLEALLSVDTTHLLLLEIGGNATSMKVENIIRRVVQKHKNLDIARDSPKN